MFRSLTKLRLGQRQRALGNLRRVAGMDEAARRMLLYFIVPLWVGAGLADWACHRRTTIETTAGKRESAIHALMMTEAGVPALMGLFYEINAGALAVIFGALGLHQLTAAWDVAYADDRREVTPTEQHVHGLLEQVPLMATAFLTVMHWDQARGLLAFDDEAAKFGLERKHQPLAKRYIRRLLACIVCLVALPYAEELWRCVRVDLCSDSSLDSSRSQATP
jgi:hypothetical protein